MKIEHIAMVVNDLEAAKDFFVTYFDGKTNELYHNKITGFQSYFISFDDGARLEIMNKPGMGAEKVDELTAMLKADGYEVLSGPRTTGDGYYESCVVAVEGNQIEITV